MSRARSDTPATPGAGTRWSRSSVRVWMVNGPLPTGWTAKPGDAAVTASLGTTPKVGWPRIAGSEDSGWSSSMWTTSAAGVVTPDRLSLLPSTFTARKPVMLSSWAAAGDDDPFLAIRSRVYFTSAEVMLRKLANVAPARRVKSHLRWSALAFQLTASAGWTASVSGS